MRSIAYDYQTFSLQQYGGISRYFCELAARVNRAQGFEARVIAPVHFNRHLAECDVAKTGVYVRKAWKTGPLFRAANRTLSPRLIATYAPSLIHRTFFEPMKSPSGVPVVITVHDMINEQFPDTFSASDATARNKRQCIQQADYILCNSTCTADDLIRLSGVSRSKVSVTYLGCSEQFAADAPAGEAAPHPRPYLLYVGHRAGHKNFDAMLAAYAGSRHLREEFDLIVFGGMPFTRAERERMAALKLPREGVLRWSGSDAALARGYRHARALVYPSKYEGFGIPPLEAMRAGCAVACSNTSSMPEVVGDAALLFDPTDVDGMRYAMNEICFNDRTRSQLIAAGLERGRQFSWDRCASETLAVYGELTSSR
jgi:glycosyltransferase involved in cell wall biosynthesis